MVKLLNCVQIVYLPTKQNHNASARCPHDLFAMWCPASTDLPPLWYWSTASQQQANTVSTNQRIACKIHSPSPTVWCFLYWSVPSAFETSTIPSWCWGEISL